MIMNKKHIFLAIPLILISIIGFRLATNDPSSNLPQTADTNNLRHVVMQIDGMYCAACPYNVESALKDAPGVANVTVGFVAREIEDGALEGRGEVVYDTTKTSPADLIRAIVPYKGAVLSDEATQSIELTPLSKTFGL